MGTAWTVDSTSDRAASGSAPSAAASGPIAIFLPSLVGGGAERAMLNLAAGFRDLGHGVDLVLASATGPYLAEVPAGVGVVDLGAKRVVTALPALARYLHRHRPRRLYAAMDHANVVALWARALARVRVPTVVSIRDTLSVVDGPGPTLRQRAVLELASRLYRGADGVVAVSDGAADDAATLLRIDRERIVTIPNPVLTPDLGRLAADVPRHRWLGPGGPPIILAAGRLAPQKDFPTLLRAFALLYARQPAKLIILGEGPDRAALAALARELGVAAHVDLPGFAPNPFAFMARAAAFALSSVHEGSPNVLVQALACGCPVVATDCPSGPSEILAGVGQGGALVPMRDPAAMAAALEAMLALPRPLPAPALERFDYLESARRYLAASGL